MRALQPNSRRDLETTGGDSTKCASRQTAHRSIWHGLCQMQDLLQRIDLDYYRSARLLIARAEIAQLRQQASGLARTERPRIKQHGVPTLGEAFDQTGHATATAQSASPEMKTSR